MSTGKSHRSFVSYIDKSRVYYQAHGYDRPYRWPHYEDVPFCPLPNPLADCRVGVVTTADKAPREAGRSTRLFAAATSESIELFTDKAWDREATHMDDRETYLPLNALDACVEAKIVASGSPRFYGVTTDYSQRRTIEQDAPQIEAWLREDSVDVAFMVPI